jgi:hypothetical protein
VLTVAIVSDEITPGAGDAVHGVELAAVIVVPAAADPWRISPIIGWPLEMPVTVNAVPVIDPVNVAAEHMPETGVYVCAGAPRPAE